MEDLMDTSDFVSDADFLPNAPTPAKPSGKGAPELLSDMSGVFIVACYTKQTPQQKQPGRMYRMLSIAAASSVAYLSVQFMLEKTG